MKKRGAWLSASILTILLISLAAVAFPQYIPQILFPRHQNPMAVSEEAPGVGGLTALFNLYSTALRDLNIENASGVLEEIDSIYIPEDLRFIVERFSELSREFISKINQAEANIEQAETSLRENRVSIAQSYLNQARGNLTEAKYIYTNYISDALSRLREIGLPPAGIRDLDAGYIDALRILEERISSIAKAISDLIDKPLETFLEINASPKEVEAGSYIYVWGYLKDENGDPLDGRVVAIYVGSRSYTASTDIVGFYAARVAVEEYRSRIPIYSEYVPVGEDRGLYSYSRSETIYIDVLYITPNISISLDKETYLPGDTMYISIFSDSNLRADLDLGFATIENIEVEAGKTSTVEARIPVSVPEGTYTARLDTKPRGIIAPATVEARFAVTRIEPEVFLDAPPIIVAGVPARIYVFSNTSGVLELEHRYSPARESIYIPPNRGSAVDIYIPIYSIDDAVNISYRFTPESPIYREVGGTKAIRVINPLIAGAVISLAAFIAYRASRSISVRGARQGKHPEAVEAGGADMYASARSIDVSEIERRSPREIFISLLHILKIITGLGIRGSETLREYYRRISPRLGGLRSAIHQFFTTYEAIVYGRGDLYSSLLRRLREIYARVLKVHRVG